MGLLQGQDLTILRYDLETAINDIRDILNNHQADHYQQTSELYTRINMIEARMDYLESYFDMINERLKTVEASVMTKLDKFNI